MKKIRRCPACRKYTLQPLHCGTASRSAHPAPFNPRDPYGDYRRRAAGFDEI